MNINWKVRMSNKYFWISLLPSLLLLIQSIAFIFGVEVEINNLSNQLVDVVEILFVVLSILGIVVDPTTDGVGDSKQAMTYTKPKKNE